MNFLSSDLGKAGLALAACWGVYRFVKSPQVKAAALGVAGIVVAKQLPIVGDVI